ncbi:MAG: hypothetical protein JNM72_26465 [Deltaproteobacteria bacterium]|jgi:hypothetical protein|nr:hypothetical protein [Deltaproteobacteria bacterium]
MADSLDTLQATVQAPAGQEVKLFSASGSCAAWRFLMVEAPVPLELRLRWTGRLPDTRARMSGRSLQVCLHASHVEAWVTNLGSGAAEVVGGAVLSAERVTQNVFDVAMPTQGAHAVPPFASFVRLDAPPLDNPTGSRLELLNSAGGVIAAVAVGQTVPLGRADKVRTVCPVAHRIVFSLTL